MGQTIERVTLHQCFLDFNAALSYFDLLRYQSKNGIPTAGKIMIANAPQSICKGNETTEREQKITLDFTQT